MLYSIRDREDLEKLNELISLNNRVKVVRLQDRPGKHFFHVVMRNFLNQLLIQLKIPLKI